MAAKATAICIPTTSSKFQTGSWSWRHPGRKLLQFAAKSLVSLIVGGIFALLLLIGTIAFLVRRKAILPINSLAAHFGPAIEENESLPPPATDEIWTIARRNDEIGSLAKALISSRDRVRHMLDTLEVQVAERTEELERHGRAKSNFLATMSHEIRTPMNGILAVSGSLLATRLDARQEGMVRLVHESATGLKRIVSDVLDLSKVESGQFSIEEDKFDLHEAVRSVVNINAYAADAKGISLKLDFSSETAGIYLGDATRIRQIVGNLVTNALKFTTVGEVVVRVTSENGDRNRVCLEVADTGSGIPADEVDTLFQKYRQVWGNARLSAEGTGLGLSIVKSLVELMNGSVWVKSELGKGSVFGVRLPLEHVADEESDVARPVARLAVSSDSPIERILVVEDHPQNRKILRYILAPLDIEITEAENGLAALTAFGETAFDLILMDIQMPEMDGLEATREIRRLEVEAGRPPVPIMMLSANAMSDQIAEASLPVPADILQSRSLPTIFST